MFIEWQISILEWFLKDHMTLNTGAMMPEINFAIILIYYIWIYLKIENSYSIFFIIIHCSKAEDKKFHITLVK